MVGYIRRIFLVLCGCILISLTTHSMYKAVKLDTSSLGTYSVESIKRKFTNSPVDDKVSHVFWFIQITDIHISKYHDKHRALDLSRFCEVLVPLIRPEVVIVSGDLTDARLSAHYRSAQHIEEWQAYNKAVRESGVLNITKWFDMRGNHDTFNVPNWNSTINFFRQYAIQGSESSLVYNMTIQKPYGNYSIVGFDVCLNPGVAFPLNFFGFITEDMKHLLHNLALMTNSSSHVFWFGHYPTSTIVSPYMDIRDFIGETSFAYLSGHLHTAMNFGRHMYALQPQGYWELELGDWKTNRFYRIVAVDHDLVSFADFQFSSAQDDHLNWPIILITNPKDAKFLLPHKEPVEKLINSTHIRVLAWSNSPIVNISIFVNEVYLGRASQVMDNHPLYVLKWNPKLYGQKPDLSNRPHTIRVIAKDTNGNQRQVEQYFIVNGTIEYNHAPFINFLLLSNHITNIRIVFYLVWWILFLFVLLPRILICFKIGESLLLKSHYGSGIVQYASSNITFYPTLAYILYELCGPVFMGLIADGQFGFVFSFGVVILSTQLPEGLTYLFEIIQLMLFQIFLLVLPIWYGRFNSRDFTKSELIQRTLISSDNQNDRLQMTNNWRRFLLLIHSNQLPTSLLIFLISSTLIQIGFTLWSIGLPYGFFAVLLSPSRLIPCALIWLLGISSVRMYRPTVLSVDLETS